MKDIIIYLLLFISLISLRCREDEKSGSDDYVPEVELLKFNSSTGSSIISYFFLIKNYDEKYFNQIVFQKYVVQLYDSLKNEIPARKYFGGVVFLKSDRHINIDNYDNVSYQEYKEDIVIEFRFDMKEQIENNRIFLNSIRFYEKGKDYSVGTFLFNCKPQSEVIEKLPQKRW